MLIRLLRRTRIVLVLGVLAASVLAASAQASSSATSCTGAYKGSAEAIVVPAGATCTLGAATTVSGSVFVNTGGSLILDGTVVNGSVVASYPKGIKVGGSAVTSVAGNFQITGLSGAVGEGPNSLCNLHVGQKLQILKAASSAAPVLFGAGAGCAPGTVGGVLSIAGDLTSVKVAGAHVVQGVLLGKDKPLVEIAETQVSEMVEAYGDLGETILRADSISWWATVIRNSGPVALEGNTIGGSMYVMSNTGGELVSGNAVRQTATCTRNKAPLSGSGNTAKGGLVGCPA